jgi:hypothetical protein
VLEKFVAAQVAEFVIDRFEPIEVEHQDREVTLGATRASHFGIEDFKAV